MIYSRSIIALFFCFLIVCGCSSNPKDVSIGNNLGAPSINDPFETINRVTFSFNSMFDKTFVRPTALVYRGVVPEFMRNRITYSLNNLSMPVTAVNNLLQGELRKAGVASSRFVINSTLGILGLFDPASSFGLKADNEDFGQTLAVWGIPSGPYIVLPFLGPSSPRDFTGLLSTSLLDPMYQVGNSSNQTAFRSYRMGVGVVDFRSQNIEIFDDLQNNSLDYYAAVRSFYNQSRESQSANNLETASELENDIFDEFEDLELDDSYIGPNIEIEYSND
tara:strand:- start:53 stop:883 length:831 start_codon:yes stop_codon:yes gene_type:complete